MTKKITFIILFFVLVLGQIQAQPGNFSIKITQVYPGNSIVHSSNYNLSGELDKAEAKFRSLYTGKDANYIMELTRPSGKETKVIQNITWILIENGKRKNLKSEPAPQFYYLQPTTVEYYNCDIRGNKKGYVSKFYYEYFYRFYKGNDTIKYEKYQTFGTCEKTANEFFEKNKVDSLLCKIKIYDFKGTVKDSTLNNLNEYNKYRAKQKQIADSILLNKTKTKKEVIENEIKTDTTNNKENVKILLKQLQTNVDSLKKGEKDFRQKMNKIIEEADKIIEMMKIDLKEFNRNKYFEGDLEDLKNGIKELVRINNKKKK